MSRHIVQELKPAPPEECLIVALRELFSNIAPIFLDAPRARSCGNYVPSILDLIGHFAYSDCVSISA
jgi:hypothetical protein